jgi:hypothetical protein
MTYPRIVGDQMSLLKTIKEEIDTRGLFYFMKRIAGALVLHLRDMSKWWLDMVRNLVVVAVLQYLAVKSGDAHLKILFYVSFYALFLYIFTYLMGISVPLRGHPVLIVLISIASGALVLYAGNYLLKLSTTVVDEISRMQGP